MQQIQVCRPEHDKEYDKADKDDNSDDGADKPESNTGHVLAGALSVLDRPGDWGIFRYNDIDGWSFWKTYFITVAS